MLAVLMIALPSNGENQRNKIGWSVNQIGLFFHELLALWAIAAAHRNKLI